MSKNQGFGHGRGLTPPAAQMPGFVRSALTTRALMDRYRERPDYQQKEYLEWINGAKLQDTKRKRLTQMLEEIEKGDAYMGAPWTPPPKPAS
jgi:hypothetical protein